MGTVLTVFFTLVFGTLYNVSLTWENIVKYVLFLNHFIGFRWCAGLCICNKEGNISNTLSRPVDVNKKKWLENTFRCCCRNHPPTSFVGLSPANWPNYYQFFTRQYTKIYIFCSLIRLIYCFVIAAVCHVIIIYFVNEHDTFSPSSSKCVCVVEFHH